jgi:hypothetical protein
MGGLIQPSPAIAERNTSQRTIIIAIVVVIAVVGAIALFLREPPRAVAPPPAYVTRLQISDPKMSQAQNFVGANVTYIDGTITNTGDKTVTRAVVRVTFKDAYNQIAQREDLPVRLLQTGGPYPEAIDLAASPLAPGQSKTFRLTFEHISEQWSQAYPEMQITDVVTK